MIEGHYTEESKGLNIGKLWFLICAIIMIAYGLWLGSQMSATEGVTLAGRYGLWGLLGTAFLVGIIGPTMRARIPEQALGGLLAGVGSGMLLGVFVPNTLLRIPPDVFSTLVENIGAMFSQAEWGIPMGITILIIMLALSVAFFLGSAVTKVFSALHGWLRT